MLIGIAIYRSLPLSMQIMRNINRVCVCGCVRYFTIRMKACSKTHHQNIGIFQTKLIIFYCLKEIFLTFCPVLELCCWKLEVEKDELLCFMEEEKEDCCWLIPPPENCLVVVELELEDVEDWAKLVTAAPPGAGGAARG